MTWRLSSSSKNAAPYFRRKPAAASREPTPTRSNKGVLAGRSDSPTWKRGKRSRSKQTTSRPARARRAAAVAPAGPPPTTTTSARSGSTSGLDRHTRRRLRPRRSKAREPAPEAAERLADQERGDLASIDDGTESAPATARVDAPDGHRHEGSPGSRRAEEDLGLEHEALAAEGRLAEERGRVDPVTALRVADGDAGQPPDPPVRRPDRAASQDGDRVAGGSREAVPQHERVRAASRRRHETQEVVRVVLAIAVEGHDGARPAPEGLCETGPERRRLAPAARVTHDPPGAGGRRRFGRAVARSVVDHDDVHPGAETPDHGSDGRGFVERGDHGQDHATPPAGPRTTAASLPPGARP